MYQPSVPADPLLERTATAEPLMNTYDPSHRICYVHLSAPAAARPAPADDPPRMAGPDERSSAAPPSGRPVQEERAVPDDAGAPRSAVRRRGQAEQLDRQAALGGVVQQPAQGD